MGDCAETFSECSEATIHKKLEFLQVCQFLIIEHGELILENNQLKGCSYWKDMRTVRKTKIKPV